MSATGYGLVVVVFVAVYLGMALGRYPGLAIDRTGIALVGAIVLHLAGVVDGEGVLRAIDFPTLVVLFGLMILSSQFAACEFYSWCSARVATADLSPPALLALTVAVTGLLSAVLANDVVVFAMTPMLCAGLSRRGLDPRPFVVALAGAANAGSAATVIGNPQNILIAQSGGLDFWIFLAVCGPPAAASLAVVYATVRWLAREQLTVSAPVPEGDFEWPALDRPGFVKALLATAVLLVLFATPLPQVEGVLIVAGALLISRRLATRRMLALVDWHLLVLFAALFVVTDAVAATGTPTRLLAALADAGFGYDRLRLLVPLTIIGSNTIGNVPLVVLLLQTMPDATPPVLYALALLSTLAGNLLLTGSMANIIAAERAQYAGVSLGFAEHARYGVPMALASMALSGLWLLLVAGVAP